MAKEKKNAIFFGGNNKDVAEALEIITKGTKKYPINVTLEALCVYLGATLGVLENEESKKTSDDLAKEIIRAMIEHKNGIQRIDRMVGIFSDGGSNGKKEKKRPTT